MLSELDVAVIGAGLAGSSISKLLADKGWAPVLIDSRRFPRHKVCGEFLSPESQGMLEEMGLRGHIESLHPVKIGKIRLFAGHGEALEIPLPKPAIGVSRYALDSILHFAASEAGADVRTETTVMSVRPEEKGYTIVAKRGGETYTFRVKSAVAAWGASSRLDSQRQGGNLGSGSSLGVKSHFIGIPIEPVVELYLFREGYVGISPVADDTVNVAALLARDAFSGSDMPAGVLGWIHAAARRHPRLQAKLAQAEPVPGTQAAVAPVHLNSRPHTWGELPHVGDASLMLPPLCGDGMSMALRSAQLCASLADAYLQGSISLSEWQREYASSVQREFGGPLRWGRLLHALSSIPVVPGILLQLLRQMPDAASALVEWTRIKER